MNNIKLYLGPQQLNAPDDLESEIIAFLDGATKSLDIAIQELDNLLIAEAITRAKLRGVRVRVVVEADYLVQTSPSKTPFIPGGGREQNRKMQNALLRAKIKVYSDFNPKIFHQKFIVRDKESLLTGSTNFTDYGVSTNLNHIVIIHNKAIAKLYTSEFKEIMSGRFGKDSEIHAPIPKTIIVDGIPVKVLFAPEHNPEMEIMKQMLKAKDRIDFAIFTFAQSSGIDDTMIALAKQGIQIRGAMEANQAGQKWAATKGLREACIKIWEIKQQRISNGNKLRKLHHKLMVIDGRVVIAGSFNYTAPANRTNDENIIIIGSNKEAEAESVAKQAALGARARGEIDRIIKEFGN